MMECLILAGSLFIASPTGTTLMEVQHVVKRPDSEYLTVRGGGRLWHFEFDENHDIYPMNAVQFYQWCWYTAEIIMLE